MMVRVRINIMLLRDYCSSTLGLGFLGLFISYFLYIWRIQVQSSNSNGILNTTRTIDNNRDVEFSSSVWCVGSNNSDRFCTFKNLCYASDQKEFVFYHGPHTVLFGVPLDRFNPALAELSSVENHNAEFFHYTDLPLNVFKIEDTTFFETPVLLFNRFHPENLMHIFHDDLLPLYSTLSMICKGNYDEKICNISVIFADENMWGLFSYLYKALFRDSSLIQEFKETKVVCFKEAHVGVNKQTVWYQYGFKLPQGAVDIHVNINAASSHIKNFKKYFEQTFTLSSIENNDKPICIIFSRKTSRLILNMDQLIELVSSTSSCIVKVLNLEEYTVLEIIPYLKKASLVLGMHGSLLILSLFLHPKSILIELFPFGVNPLHYTPYKTLASLPGIEIIYETWQNTIQENTVVHPENPPDVGGIAHLSKNEQERIMNSEEVPIHLCCDNSEWLFRIYQDTVVDLISLQTVLELALYRQNLSKNDENKTFNNFSNIHPGKVRNAACQVNSKNNEMRVEWQIPWNLLFFKSDVVDYELLIQKSSSDDVKAYTLRSSSYVFKGIDTLLDYWMWVRCISDRKPGPFIEAVKCIEI